MPTATYTGKLINEDAEVSIENGPLLAVRGPNPIATAAGRFARFGQTQPVTVTGEPGQVDTIDVLFVTSIQWAAIDFSLGAEAIGPPAAAAGPKKAPAKKRAKKAAVKR